MILALTVVSVVVLVTVAMVCGAADALGANAKCKMQNAKATNGSTGRGAAEFLHLPFCILHCVLWHIHNAPRTIAGLDLRHHLAAVDVDDRHVVGRAVGGKDGLAVR